MKKIIALMICVLMLFGLAACAEDNGNVDKGNNGTVNEKNDKPDDKGAVDKVEDKIEDATDDAQTLEGTAQGYGGEVKVTVKVEGDDIISVEAVGEKETKDIGGNAIKELPDKIEEADSTEVDGVSGATVTSNAIKEAVNKALDTKK